MGSESAYPLGNICTAKRRKHFKKGENTSSSSRAFWKISPWRPTLPSRSRGKSLIQKGRKTKEEGKGVRRKFMFFEKLTSMAVDMPV